MLLAGSGERSRVTGGEESDWRRWKLSLRKEPPRLRSTKELPCGGWKDGKAAGSGDGIIFLTRAAYERTSRKEAARSGDSPPSGSDDMLDEQEVPFEALALLRDKSVRETRRKRWEREFVEERIVLVLGSRLRKPNASSRVRRPFAAESSSESLAVASVIADGVEEAVLKLNRGYSRSPCSVRSKEGSSWGPFFILMTS